MKDARFGRRPAGELLARSRRVSFGVISATLLPRISPPVMETDPKTLADAIRQTNITEKMTLGGPIKFNPKGQVEGIGSACVQNLNLTPTVVLPKEAASAKPVFPVPGYKKA